MIFKRKIREINTLEEWLELKYVEEYWGKEKAKPFMIMMVGIPGSGKTTAAQQLARIFGAEIISSDDIRKELYSDENIQGDNNEVFSILHKRVLENLKNNKSVIYDATNLKMKNRKHFLNQLRRRVECKRIAYIIPTPYKKCLKNNKKRERKVSKDVIKRMYKSFQMPHYSEGFDDIIIEDMGEYINVDMLESTTQDDWIKAVLASEHLMFCGHDNIHHHYTIGEHCLRAHNYAKHWVTKNAKYNNVDIAAGLHDIGKRFCKERRDHKGNKTEFSHYYNHECVSAYKSISYLQTLNICVEDIVEIASLISNHMKLYQFDKLASEKMKKKISEMIGQYGEEYVDKLKLLREADLYAH